MVKINKIQTCLWFDTQAEEAVNYYTSIFKNSKIDRVTHYGEQGQEIHGMPPGMVLTIEFHIEDYQFLALNGGPRFRFTEAISIVINCDSQEEIDYYWEKLSRNGDPQSQQCGWLKDKYGLSWQIVWPPLIEMIGDQKTERSKRAMHAMMKMKKLDIKELEKAYSE